MRSIKYITVLLTLLLLFTVPALSDTRTLCSSGCDYDDCADWVTYVEGIGTLTEPEILEVTEDDVETACLFTTTPVTTSANYIEIRGADSCKHEGYVNTGTECGIFSTDSAETIEIDAKHVRIRDLVILTPYNNGNAISLTGIGDGEWIIENNIIRSTNIISPASGNGIKAFLSPASGAGVAKISNNIISGFGSGTSGSGITIDVREDKVAYIYNNTLYGNAYGIIANQFHGDGALLHVKNNLVVNSVTTDFTYPQGVINLTANVDNFSEDLTGTTTGITPVFVNPGINDFRLDSTDTEALDEGTDLSADAYPITTDIAGTARPSGAAYDVGAYEVVVIPSPTPTPTVTPSATPTPTPTVTPSASPSATPTVSPTATPNPESTLPPAGVWYDRFIRRR